MDGVQSARMHDTRSHTPMLYERISAEHDSGSKRVINLHIKSPSWLCWLVMLLLLSGCGSLPRAVPTAIASRVGQGASTEVSPSPATQAALDRTGHIAYLIDVFDYGMQERIRIIDPSNGSERSLAIGCYICDSIAWSRDGQFIAYSGTVNPPTGHSEIFTLDLATGGIQQVTNSSDLKYGIALAPDAKRAVIDIADPRNGEPDLAILNMESGQVRKLAATPGQEYSPVWSPDGQQLAYAYNGDGRKEWNAWATDTEGGNARQLSTLTVGGQISWSPSGMMLAVSSPIECGSIYLLDVNSGFPTRLTNMDGCASNPVWSPNGQTIAFVDRVYVDPVKRSDVKEWAIYLVSTDGKETVLLKSGSGSGNPAPVFLAWSGE